MGLCCSLGTTWRWLLGEEGSFNQVSCSYSSEWFHNHDDVGNLQTQVAIKQKTGKQDRGFFKRRIVEVGGHKKDCG